MFAWIVIVAAWIAIILLILHDATKHDNDGSAILIAAKSFRALISRAGQKTRKLQNTARPGIPGTGATEPPRNHSVATAAGASTSEPTRQGKTGVAEPVAAPRKKSWRNGNRVSATIPELEMAITMAVKKAAPECEAFVGVIVQKKAPKSRLDVNWQLRGAKFGNADRKVAGEILATTIENMQREFYLVER